MNEPFLSGCIVGLIVAFVAVICVFEGLEIGKHIALSDYCVETKV